MSPTRTSTLLALLLCVLAAGEARAQIYVARDAKGTVVFSDRPLGPDALTYAVPGSAGLRTTRRVEAPPSADVDELIAHHAARHGIRPELVRAVIAVESGFNPRARSHKGAMGLMQLMPATAARFEVERPYDPAENIRAGVAYLRELLDRYQENETLALAAYNAGPGAVDRHGLRVPPYRETQDYVQRVRGKTGALSETRTGTVIYRVLDLVNGREVPRYTNVRPPADTPYEVVAQLR